MRWALFALVLVAGPAEAQGIDWGLLTPPSDPTVQQQRAYDYAAQVAADALRRQVGSLAVAGQCEEARATAYQAGDFGLGEQAYAFCIQQRR